MRINQEADRSEVLLCLMKRHRKIYFTLNEITIHRGLVFHYENNIE